MLALDLAVKALRQARPVARFHQEGDSRVAGLVSASIELAGTTQLRSAEGSASLPQAFEATPNPGRLVSLPVMAPAIHTAAISPDFDTEEDACAATADPAISSSIHRHERVQRLQPSSASSRSRRQAPCASAMKSGNICFKVVSDKASAIVVRGVMRCDCHGTSASARQELVPEWID